MGIPQDLSLPMTAALSDGQVVLVRRIRRDDAPLLVDMFHHLSDRTRQLRFHSYVGKLSKERIWREAIALSDLDPERQAALVALTQQAPDEGEAQIVGVARFARATADDVEAEAAIVVRDDYQKRGLGTQLLALLIPLARSMGIKRLAGWVMSENMHMLGILQKADLPMQRETRAGETYVSVSI